MFASIGRHTDFFSPYSRRLKICEECLVAKLEKQKSETKNRSSETKKQKIKTKNHFTRIKKAKKTKQKAHNSTFKRKHSTLKSNQKDKRWD